MKLIVALLAMIVPATVHAQAFKSPAEANWGPVVSGGIAPTPLDLRVPFEGWHADDTPTMWAQRHKRVVAFRAKVADLLQADDGVLTDDSRLTIAREWRKLRYHNR